MIPNYDKCKDLWEKYQVPPEKCRHLEIVANVSVILANKIKNNDKSETINIGKIKAAALLHDIDKAVEKLAGESHPDACIRILEKEGMNELIPLIKTHPLHTILEENIKPKTLEQKILFLADKMVKYEFIGVDKRFSLWYQENLPLNAKQVLDKSYPLVKALEKSLLKLAGISSLEIFKK